MWLLCGCCWNPPGLNVCTVGFESEAVEQLKPSCLAEGLFEHLVTHRSSEDDIVSCASGCAVVGYVAEDLLDESEDVVIDGVAEELIEDSEDAVVGDAADKSFEDDVLSKCCPKPDVSGCVGRWCKLYVCRNVCCELCPSSLFGIVHVTSVSVCLFECLVHVLP